jgi:hypothetical protein
MAPMAPMTHNYGTKVEPLFLGARIDNEMEQQREK